jgi:hypothetical protein
MPSTISAGTTAGTALNFVSDTTGNLAFQTNGTTTAMTIDTSQNVTFANNVTYTGTITATAGFSGNGAGLTAINASNVASGTLAVARGGTGLTTLTANNVLIGNGTSNVAFVAPGSNGNVLTSNGTAWVSSASSVTRSQLPAGSVLQVVSTTKTDIFSSSSTSYVDVTGLSVSITPTSASNKILVMMTLTCGCDGATVFVAFRLMRDSTAIDIGDAAGSRTRATGGAGRVNDVSDTYSINANFLDSPGVTSAITYKVQMLNNNGNNAFVGSNGLNADNPATGRYPSTITVMEIAA